jgi:hypothetical protein
LLMMHSSSAQWCSQQPGTSLQQQQQQQSHINCCTDRGSSSSSCTCACCLPAHASALSAQADTVCNTSHLNARLLKLPGSPVQLVQQVNVSASLAAHKCDVVRACLALLLLLLLQLTPGAQLAK